MLLRRFSTLLLLGSLISAGQLFGQETRDATEGLPSPLEAMNRRQQSDEDRRAGNRAALIEELDNLTPGELEAGSAREAAFGEVVDLVLSGEGQAARDRLAALAEQDSDLPPVDLLWAGLLYATQNSEIGKASLEKAALASPGYPGIYAAFARVAINEQRWTDAEALLEKTGRLIDSGGYDEETEKFFRGNQLSSLIDVALGRDQLDLAETQTAKLRELQPDSQKVVQTSAFLEFKKGNIDESLEWLGKRRESSNQGAAELIVARWFLQQNQTEEAGKYLEQAANKYPNDPRVQFQFAEFSLANEDFQEARAAIDKVEARDGENPSTLLLKAQIAFATEEYPLAEAQYNRLLRMNPGNANAANMLALALIESEDSDKQERARAMAQRTFQQDPNNPIATASLGWILLKSGEVDQATQLLARAAQAPTIPPEVSYFLASLLKTQGQSERARMVLEPALNSESFFLYRSRAEALMKELNQSGDGGGR